MDGNQSWWWYSRESSHYDKFPFWSHDLDEMPLSEVFDIEPVKDWTKSLIRYGDDR